MALGTTAAILLALGAGSAAYGVSRAMSGGRRKEY